FRIYGDDPTNGGKATDAYGSEVHERIRRADLSSRFRLAGHIPDPPKIMDELDVLAQATHTDSFGRVVVEAMAAGLPVAGVKGGGVGEIVEDGVTCFLTPPNDVRALAGTIERLVQDAELRRTMGQMGRERAERFYSLEACADGMMRVYEAA